MILKTTNGIKTEIGNTIVSVTFIMLTPSGLSNIRKEQILLKKVSLLLLNRKQFHSKTSRQTLN